MVKINDRLYDKDLKEVFNVPEERAMTFMKLPQRFSSKPLWLSSEWSNYIFTTTQDPLRFEILSLGSIEPWHSSRFTRIKSLKIPTLEDPITELNLHPFDPMVEAAIREAVRQQRRFCETSLKEMILRSTYS